MALSLAECGGCFALGGGFLADINGDGDDFDGVVAPFVWMPGGMGRFTLLATFCWAMGPTGAIVTKSRCAAGASDYDGISAAFISLTLFW